MPNSMQSFTCFSSFKDETYRQTDWCALFLYAYSSSNLCKESIITRDSNCTGNATGKTVWKKKWVLTGILEVRKNSSRASREPSVEACTYTPLSCSLILLRADRKSRETSSRRISTSSDFWATWRFRPKRDSICNFVNKQDTLCC